MYKTLEVNKMGNVVMVDRKTVKDTSISIGTSWIGSSAPYTQNIPCDSLSSESNVIEISLPPSATAQQVEQFNALMLQDGGQTASTFTLRAFGTKNTVEIPITVIVRKDL